MNHRLLFSLLLICFINVSCSIISDRNDSEDSLLIKKAKILDQKKTMSLCAYRELKGIAEFIRREKSILYFKFYPGDEIISVNSKEDFLLKAGDELRAIKNILVNGDSRICKPVELILIQQNEKSDKLPH